jgi:hypothetical protein
MTKTRVTRIVRIVFLIWLVVSIALVLTTIVRLRPLPDQKALTPNIQPIHRAL